jgi:phosphoglycerol transferase MdoB-like AlkP superfamily enzyme
MLKKVRYTVNVYTDTQRRGLLEVRRRILITIMLTEVATLGLLVLAILKNAGVDQILAATSFFVVGTLVSVVYNRLYTPLETQPGIDEDYGLGLTRLLATPLFSGLAAIAGVLLVEVVPDVVNLNGSSAANGQIPALDAIFVFDSINFVLAAIFGLSPALLFDRLGQGNKLLANLNSTKPTSQASN